MPFRLRAESPDFLATAPKRWAFQGRVEAPQETVFDAIAADPSTWTWFPGFSSGRYEGPGPHGIGSIREVRVGPSIYRETIVAWDRPARWVYRVDSTTVPLAHALVEEWTVEPDGNSGSRVRWTFAVDPRAMFRVLGPMTPMVLGRVFRKAMRNLEAELRTRASREPA
ncbi:MAG: SRPBCC family protein [Actinomycetota bacterium]